MGVNGLWQVLQPCARPTNLATLNRKRLAVDASIWIYQFLKAVRDKEGNALRNSHVVGFFRRICKLLWFGIQPVFVFDGGAPVLKRSTLQARRRRREGRRDDAVRTAGKLLAVQMQRIAEEEEEKRRKRRTHDATGVGDVDGVAAGEVLPSADDIVYAEEQLMSQQDRLKSRKFTKQDAYHLPDLDHESIGGMGTGGPEDPRIMSIDELEAYARQFHAGEDVNLYDFSKIDFDGEFFKSLPPPDRYNILNASRIRSRLRLGLSKEQLDTMFPDRMAFSRFQIERVRERNHLTQRLMLEVGMTGLDLTIAGAAGGAGGIGARVAGERNREYILVKNDSAEGGWALGVVSRDKDRGAMHKPIDVDALQFRYDGDEENAAADDDNDDDVEFEDVPIEGPNRLPKITPSQGSAVAGGQGFVNPDNDVDEDSLFVKSYEPVEQRLPAASLVDTAMVDSLSADEDEDLNRAITMSLQNQHGVGLSPQEETDDEGVDDDRPAPQWTQKAASTARPIFGSTGNMVAHVVNNRANAVIASSAKARQSIAVNNRNSSDDDSSDSELDIRAAMAKATRKKKQHQAPVQSQPRPVQPPSRSNNSFDGPLPFEKLDWRTSIFEKKPAPQKVADMSSPFAASTSTSAAKADNVAATAAALVTLNAKESAAFEPDSEEEFGGGFEREPQESVSGDGSAAVADGSEEEEAPLVDDSAPRPLPPWMVDSTDIRTAVRQLRKYDDEINAEDRAMALEEAKIWQRRQESRVIKIDSSGDEGSDVEVLDAPPAPKQKTPEKRKPPERIEPEPASSPKEADAAPVLGAVDADETLQRPGAVAETRSPSPEMEFEDVTIPEQSIENEAEKAPTALEVNFGPTDSTAAPNVSIDNDGLFAGDGGDAGIEADGAAYEISDPEDEELLVQMAEEVEEHARFADSLNHRTAEENRLAYEQELKALRNQQKKDRRDADEVTQVMVSECQALLRLFGIPYITAPMEAEAQCAELVALGLVDGIVTDDSDTFLFGGTRVYKNMFNGNKFVECYLAADLEREMSLSRETLISIAQLLGSDYTDGIPGVGPVTAMEIISEFPGADGLEAFRTWWTDVQTHNRPKEADADSPFRRKFRKAQATKLFLPLGFPSPAVTDAYLHPEVDGSTEPFQWGVPDLDGLRIFLMSTIGWSQERTDEVLVPVIRDMNRREVEGTQSNITRFFGGGVGAGARMTEAQVLQQQERQKQKQPAPIPAEFAPRHAPRSKNTASSRRLAAAVSKLKASTTAAEAAASVMRISTAPPTSTGRKRKGRASTVADADSSDEQHEANEAEAIDLGAGVDADYTDGQAASTKRRREKNTRS